jgi:hypothetical protein
MPPFANCVVADQCFIYAAGRNSQGAAHVEAKNRPGGQNDRVAGGPGLDAVDYSDATGPVSVTLDRIPNDGPALGTRRGIVQADVERIDGTRFDDVIAVGSIVTAVLVNGMSGNDTLTGGAQETLASLGLDQVARRHVTLSGGEGNDVVSDTDIAEGGPGDDVLRGRLSVVGGDGADEITGVLFSFEHPLAYLDGGAGPDRIGGVRAGTVLGGDGDDRITCGTVDFLDAGAGNDTINLSDGRIGRTPTILAGAGNDSLGGSAAGRIDLGDGDDVLARDVTINWPLERLEYASVGRATIDGGAGRDSIFAFPASDLPDAERYSAVIIRGGEGDDHLGGIWIDGQAGNDTLYTEIVLNEAVLIRAIGGSGDDTFAQARYPADRNRLPTYIFYGSDITSSLLIDAGDGDDVVYGYRNAFEPYMGDLLQIRFGGGADRFISVVQPPATPGIWAPGDDPEAVTIVPDR